MERPEFVRTIEDWLYPRRCPVCDEAVDMGNLICESCRPKLRYIKSPRCYKCGKQLSSEQEEYCFDCRSRQHFYDRGLALYDYGSIHSSIYRFKYGARQEYADFYVQDLVRHLRKQIENWNPDGIIPVPLSRRRQEKRGYNQAALLARGLSEFCHIPCYEDVILRRKNTAPMKELSALQRQINLKNAFIMHRDDVKLKRILIVDDIYTTGSTIDSVARIFKENGTQNIYFITLAIGMGL